MAKSSFNESVINVKNTFLIYINSLDCLVNEMEELMEISVKLEQEKLKNAILMTNTRKNIAVNRKENTYLKAKQHTYAGLVFKNNNEFKDYNKILKKRKRPSKNIKNKNICESKTYEIKRHHNKDCREMSALLLNEM